MSSSLNVSTVIMDAEASAFAAHRKEVASLIAAFALAGFAVHPVNNGGFTVCRWNLSKHCPDFASLTAFGAQVGACL